MMKIVRYPGNGEWVALSRRPSQSTKDEVFEQARSIIERVRETGDDALVELASELDGVELERLAVGPDSIDRAVAEIEPELRDAIEIAIRNVRTFHQTQTGAESEVETQLGITCWRRRTPINPVGLYIPAGTAPLFSSVIMLAVPAQIAGCENIVICSPPNHDGSVHPDILAVAGILGLDRVFAVGGAQAIAAMAYGTATIPRVNKIFGPGNNWVTAAKQIVSAEGIPIDLPAGPTELLIVADETADPEFVASDVLAQAEHGPDSVVLLVTWSPDLAKSVNQHIERRLADLPRRKTAEAALSNSCAIIVMDEGEALAFANQFAPEHLSLQCKAAGRVAKDVENAGSVFVGHLTPEALGDYASGTNHTLPTSGFARSWSGVSVESFCKYITFQRASAEGIDALGPVVEVLAEHEGLAGHAASIRTRLDRPQDETD